MRLYKKSVWAAVLLAIFCIGLITVPLVAQQPPTKEKEAEIKKLKDQIDQLKQKRAQELQKIEDTERIEREKTIADYERFLAVYKDSPKRADILFQLSRAYFEKEEAEYNKIMAVYEANLAKYGQGLIKEKPAEPVKDYAKTIKTFKQLLDEFPNFDMMDAVLYTLGYCYKEMKQNEEEFAIYTELAEKFPKSKYAFEGHFHIGEYLFEQHQYLQAIEHYKKVINAPTRVNFEKAVYKLGWSYYKMSDYQNAIDKFVGLVDKADVNSDLRDEAVTYIAISFSEYGGADRCVEYFKSIGGRPYEVEVLHRLGDIYKRTDKLDEAMQTYDKFLSVYPYYKKAPQVHSNIIDCLRILKQYDKANAQREVLTDRYKMGSEWYTRNTEQKDRDEATEIVEKILYENVLYYYLEADKKGQKDLYDKAIERARKYLSMFPDGKNAYELNYLLAECLYKLERFDEAVVEYQKVALNKSSDKYCEVSAYNVVKCYEQIDSKTVTDKNQKETMNPTKQKMLSAINSFEQQYPTSKSTPELLYLKGGVFFRMEDYNQARDAYTKIVQQFPQEQLAARGARMVAISFNKEKNFQKAEEWFNIVISNPNVDKKDLEEAKRMVAASVYEQAAVLRKDKKNLEAAVIYKRLADNYPESEFADKAISNAGACYEDEQQWEQAAAMYELMANKYPNSILAVAALGRAAACYEKGNNIDGAIKSYELIATKYPNAKEASGALYSAGLLAEKSSFWQRAIDNYALLQQKYPNSEYTVDGVFSIALCYEKLNNYDMAVNYFKSFGERYVKEKPSMAVDALCRAGEGYFKNGNYLLSRDLFQKALATYTAIMEQGGQVEETYPAKAQFYLGEIIYHEFEMIEFKQPKKEMQKAQNEKATLLREAIGHYTEAIKYAIEEWTTRSTYKIGLAFEEFGNTWYKQELPSRMSEAEKIGALIKIREQVPNFYNQAHTYYKSNIKFSKDQNLKANEWVDKSKERATAALYRIGEIYEEIAGMFRGAPIPGEFTKEEKELYLSELQKNAVQREDVAVEVYKNALIWTVSEQIQNEWVEKLKERLNALMPGVVDQILAGTVKATVATKEIKDLVKTTDIKDIIEQTKEDRSKWTDNEWKELQDNSSSQMQEQESAIASLKSELAKVKESINAVKKEIEALQH